MSYMDFLSNKKSTVNHNGPTVTANDMHPSLHDWQIHIIQWAVRTRRAAIWADTGLGKTRMQLEWARLSGGTALVLAPLAVCHQTVREAQEIGIDAAYIRNSDQITGPGMWVTNYENVPNIDPDMIDAVVLDESSILKQSTGKTRNMLIDVFQDVPAR